MNELTWQDIHKELEERKESITPSDFRYYNIARLPLIAKKTEEFSVLCEQCKSNLNILHNQVLKLPIDKNDFKAWKDFGHENSAVVNHLKEKHALRFHGYYLSLYTVIGLFASFAVVIGMAFLLKISILNEISLLILLIGVVTGRFLGFYKDKEMNKSDLQM